MEFISDRISVVKNEEELSIVISANADKRKNRLMLAWLLLWSFCGVAIVAGFFQADDKKMRLMIAIWFAFWIYFEYIIGKAWRWKRFGKEIVKVRKGELAMKKDVRGRGWVLIYPVREIKNLRFHEDKTPNWVKKFGEDYWSLGGETLAFNHQGKEIRFGHQLGKDEQQKVMQLLKKYLQINARKAEKAEEEAEN